MRGLDAGSSSATAAAPRQGLAVVFTRTLYSTLQGLDKWLAARKAQIPLA